MSNKCDQSDYHGKHGEHMQRRRDHKLTHKQLAEEFETSESSVRRTLKKHKEKQED